MGKQSRQLAMFFHIGHKVSGNHLNEQRIRGLLRGGVVAQYVDGVLQFVQPDGTLALIAMHGMRHQQIRGVKVPAMQRGRAATWCDQFNAYREADARANRARAQSLRTDGAS